MKTVGVTEAKARFSYLLDRVAKGERIVVSKRGVPVAVLQPVGSSKSEAPRKVIDRLIQFGKKHRLRGLKIRKTIEEGRR